MDIGQRRLQYCLLFCMAIMQMFALVQSEEAFILESPSNMTARIGQTVTLTCTFNKPVMCIWIKDRYAVILLGRYSFKSKINIGNKSSDCSLQISSLEENDFTKWECSAFTASGRAVVFINKQEMSLTVSQRTENKRKTFVKTYFKNDNTSAPKYVRIVAEGYKRDEIELNETSLVQLNCTSDGLPKPTIEWEHWSEENQAWKHLNSSHKGPSIEVAGTGIYRCKASNELNLKRPTISVNRIQIYHKEIILLEISEFHFYGYAIGIPIGCVVFITAVAIIVIKLCQKRNKSPKQKQRLPPINVLNRWHARTSTVEMDNEDDYLTPNSVATASGEINKNRGNSHTRQQCDSEIYINIISATEGEYSYVTYTPKTT